MKREPEHQTELAAESVRLGTCDNCERCRWQPDEDCGLVEHPHCEKCGHCIGRHGSWVTHPKGKPNG